MGRGVGPGSCGRPALWPPSSLALFCAACVSERCLSIPPLTLQRLLVLDLAVAPVVILQSVSGSRRTRIPGVVVAFVCGERMQQLCFLDLELPSSRIPDLLKKGESF